MKTILNSLALLLITVAVSVASDKTVIRVGHFPNITHVQGLIAHNLSRQGKGWFEARLGPGVEIQWFTYNAGPSAMEAIFAKSIELTYVGPGPALNAYAKSQGEEIRIGLQLAQEDLAQLLGASRQRVNQELKGFERDGAVRIEPTRLVVLSKEKLLAISSR